MGIFILILIAAGFGFLVYKTFNKKKNAKVTKPTKPTRTRPTTKPVIPGYNEYGVPTKLPNETPEEFEERENAYYYSQTRG